MTYGRHFRFSIDADASRLARGLEVAAVGEALDDAGIVGTYAGTLLLVTEDGLEVHGTLQEFSVHYPPADGSTWCEDDGDCVAALFVPDVPTWSTLWLEVAAVREDCAGMFDEFPYVEPEPGDAPTG